MGIRATLATLLVLVYSPAGAEQVKKTPPSKDVKRKMTQLDYRTPRKGQRIKLTKKPLSAITIDLGAGTDKKERLRDAYHGRLYRGIVPGEKDAWRFHKRWDQRGSTLVTWVGLERLADHSRLFIQTQHTPSFRILRPSPNKVIVELDNARVPYRNDRRPIIARVRSRLIDQIVPRQVSGKRVHVVIDLKSRASFRQRTETVRYRVLSRKRKGRPQTSTTLTRHYIFLEFN